VRVLRRDHPHLELVINNSRRTPDVLKLLREEMLDVGLVGGPVTGAGLAMRAISSTRLGVLLHHDDPLAGQGPVPVRALADRHLVLVEAAGGWSIRRLVEDALDGAGVTPSDVTTMSDGLTMLAFVGAGIGVGFGSADAEALTPRHLTLSPLADGPEIPTSVVWKATNDTPALRTVLRAAERHVVEPPPAAGP
jgi:DNA-binding transcriptional LysR family regulator